MKTGIRKNYSHPEFISGSTKKDAANLFSMTKKRLDSRFHGNDIINTLTSILYMYSIFA
ncbi:hypothetical protein [Rickettsia endosymbiont of Orchestes rusci]|uniref:hypothetical protein n=1 Tax=Rickettsia endosymbiont of Orchestes rusci TaxID=3066250 RepID=UPI00313EA485